SHRRRYCLPTEHAAMSKRANIASIAVFLIVAWSVPAVAQQLAAQMKQGEQLLQQNCSGCHAIGRTGKSLHPQAPPFRTLGQRYPLEELEEALGEGWVWGHPDMPDFVFPPQQINGIIAYLKSVQER